MNKDQWAIVVTGTACAFVLSYCAAFVCQVSWRRFLTQVKKKKALKAWKESQSQFEAP